MTRLRAFFGLLAVSAGLAGAWYAFTGPNGQPVSTAHVGDRRCRGGCARPLLQVLPDGPLPSLQAAGQLQTALGGSITTTRASNKFCANASGTLVSLSSNVPCVDANGVNAEGPAINYFLQSATPATQTISLTTTGGTGGGGQYEAWISGSGSMAIAVGTATATGLPCTATAGSPCSFTVTVAGTVVFTVSGGPSWGQVENSLKPTSRITTTSTSAARAADQNDAGPLALPGNTFSVSLDFTPLYLDTNNNPDVFMAIGSAQIFIRAQTGGGGNVVTCGYFNGTTFQVNSSATLAAGVKAHLVCSYDGTNMMSCLNGSCASSAQSFTRITSFTHVWLGNDGVAAPGGISNVCVSQTASGCQ